jgi:predicted amidophosphoribosyltransferase
MNGSCFMCRAPVKPGQTLCADCQYEVDEATRVLERQRAAEVQTCYDRWLQGDDPLDEVENNGQSSGETQPIRARQKTWRGPSLRRKRGE